MDYEIQEYTTDTSASFHAVRGGISLGVIDASSALFDEGDINENAWYFNRLYVRPDYRKNGIATVLMNRFVDFIHERGLYMICDINAYGDMDRDQLFNFYQSFGFCEILFSFHDIQYPTLILDARKQKKDIA